MQNPYLLLLLLHLVERAAHLLEQNWSVPLVAVTELVKAMGSFPLCMKGS